MFSGELKKNKSLEKCASSLGFIYLNAMDRSFSKNLSDKKLSNNIVGNTQCLMLNQGA